MEPKEGDKIYIYGQIKTITKMFERTFEWKYGWARIDQIVESENPDDEVKWELPK